MRRLSYLSILALLISLIASSFLKQKDVDLRNAVSGFSPVQFTDNYYNNNPLDYANGVHCLSATLSMRPYLLGCKWGISAESIQRLLIFSNNIIYGLIFFTIGFVVTPGAELRRVAVGILLVAICVIGDGLENNLANYGQINYFGQMYAPSAILSLIALWLMVYGRFSAVFLLCALIFPIHASMGAVMIGISGLLWGCHLVFGTRDQNILLRDMLALALCMLVAISWWAIFIRPLAPQVGMGSGDWLSWARICNYHLFSADLGVLTSAGHKKIIPVVAVFLLAVANIQNLSLDKSQVRRWGVAVSITIALITAGFLIPIVAPTPSLIKLSLHRASLFLCMLTYPVAIAGLFHEGKSAWGLGRRVLAFIYLVANAISKNSKRSWVLCVLALGILGYAFWLSGYVSLLSGYASRGVGHFWSNGDIGTLFAGAVCALLWLVTKKFQSEKGRFILVAVMALVFLSCAALSGNVWSLFGLKSLMIAAGLAVVWLTSRKLQLEPVGLTLVCVVALGFSVDQLHKRLKMSHGARSSAEAFLKTQLWAKDNTPKEASFFVRPDRAYGWRDYSERASFGVLREWIHTSWLYSGDQVAFDTGMKRAAAWLGREPSQIVAGRWRSIGPGYKDLVSATLEEYLEFPTGEQLRYLNSEGVDYFVVDSRAGTFNNLQDVGPEPVVTIGNFSVYDIEQLCILMGIKK